MLIKLQTRAGTSPKSLGASILRITDGANHPAGGSGATITIRDERGYEHELQLTGAECAMLKRDLPGIAAPFTCTNTLTARTYHHAFVAFTPGDDRQCRICTEPRNHFAHPGEASKTTCPTCDGTGRTWARDNSLASIACVDCRGEGVK